MKLNGSVTTELTKSGPCLYHYHLTLINLFPFKMNYYLAGNEATKKQLIKALNQYARDRSIEQLAQSLKGILRTPVERKLLGDIRYVPIILM